MKKSTLGTNPLEEYLSNKQEQAALTEEPTEELSDRDSGKKQRITIHLPIHLIERVKNAVYWEPGMTLTAFAESAFESALQEQEEKRGQAYPERKERALKSGRPLS